MSRILLSSGNAESPIEYPSSVDERKVVITFPLEKTITSTVVCEQTGGFLVIKVSMHLKVTSGSNRYFDHSIDSFLPVRACCHAGKSRDVEMEIGLEVGAAVGGAFLNVLLDRLARQASNQHVRQWLNKLQSAVDCAENLMEEVNYEALKLKVEGQHQNLAETCTQQVLRFFSECCGRRVSDDFFLNIKEKLEDTIKSLEELEKQIGRLGLQRYFDPGKKVETRTPSTSVVESNVFGRQNEIERLIEHLVSKEASEKKLTVVPIVGMGGVGKTKWKKVSHCSKCDNYNEWDDLRNIFVHGDIGSKIIVTTRKESVALIMGSGAINVGTLSDEASWALFRRHSLENRDPLEHPQLEEYHGEMKEFKIRKPILSRVEVKIIVQRVRYPFQLNTEKFLMHDLVNDLAQIASSKLCVRLEECRGSYMLDQSHHLSYSMGKVGDFEKLTPVNKLEQLRTLLPINIQYLYLRPKLSKRVLHNILPSLRSLRALSLSNYWINELSGCKTP
ncbi:hypothetical protein T459_28745 [Capsicum annuum]|uniref:NB-ARC domain-containing protein n=1 Tax=Capsicum annuum TaxID=4072 RepID=A0A2G2YHM9_CAPAN|nr:hypothetical protein FXO37_17952 [Capsicum annuum]PHT69258.1 hypothetical protein T459_28745 [Capsicum annuum]